MTAPVAPAPPGVAGGGSDQILIERLEFRGRHGVFEHERRDGCDFTLDVCLERSQHVPGQSDRLADTVDYGAVVTTLLAVAGGPSCHLVEHLAEQMCAAVLAAHPVDAVTLTLRKLSPPVPGPALAVGVRVRRSRPTS
jgi:dihydroneopterin aldolase